ncbi:hypothetical protein DFJ63DRAFT_317472 [Scheffersomyces coipomensis]|uniref:uncharacterized protein n=1 Tax=Scheffersomyces coipomensis TaxID=1788519 RepID=UPI00315DDA81
MNEDQELRHLIDQIRYTNGNGDVLLDIEKLKLLGDALRDEETRSNPIINESIPILVDIFIELFSIDNLMSNFREKEELLRVFINVLAFNDKNRLTLINIDKPSFWGRLQNQICVIAEEQKEITSRVVLLLSQFIYDTDHQELFVTKLYERRLYSSLFQYFELQDLNDVEGYERLLDLFYELINNHSHVIQRDEMALKVPKFITFIVKLLTHFDHTIDESEHILEKLTQIISTLTSFEFIYALDDTPELFSTIVDYFISSKNYIPNATVKRNWVNIICNFVYIKQYFYLDEDLSYLIKLLKKNDVDPYVLCGIAVFIGNYIHDKETLQAVKTKLEHEITWEKFVDIYFNQINITDVFLIQSIQAFLNIMDKSIANIILRDDNFDGLLKKYNRVILDNKDFYPEILTQYLKFIYKLVRHKFLLNNDEDDDDQGSDILQYYELWSSIIDKCDDGFLQLYLLEAFITHYDPTKEIVHSQFICQLLTTSVTKLEPQGQANLDLVIQKLKALGIFNHILLSKEIGLQHILDKWFNNDVDTFISNYLQPYYEYLIQLNESLQSSTSHPSHDLIKNNAKFISGSSLPLIRDFITDSTSPSSSLTVQLDEICLICKTIIDL